MAIPVDSIQAITEYLGVEGAPYQPAHKWTPRWKRGVFWPVATSFKQQQHIDQQERDEHLARFDTILADLRRLLEGQPYQVYKHITSWGGLHCTFSDGIVLCPGRTMLSVMTYEHDDGQLLHQQLKPIDRTYGLTLLGAGYQTLEFQLHTFPTGAEARALADDLITICSDVMDGFPEWEYEEGENIDIYSSWYFDFSDRRIALWWD